MSTTTLTRPLSGGEMFKMDCIDMDKHTSITNNRNQ